MKDPKALSSILPILTWTVHGPYTLSFLAPGTALGLPSLKVFTCREKAGLGSCVEGQNESILGPGHFLIGGKFTTPPDVINNYCDGDFL